MVDLKKRILEIAYKHKLSHLGSYLSAADIIKENEKNIRKKKDTTKKQTYVNKIMPTKLNKFIYIVFFLTFPPQRFVSIIWYFKN